jgi:hypothetical protein
LGFAAKAGRGAIAVLANLDPETAGHAYDFIAARLPKD